MLAAFMFDATTKDWEVKNIKDNESSSVQTGDKNNDFAASPSSSNSFSSSLKENSSCPLNPSALPVYEGEYNAVTQTSDCDISPGTLANNDTGEIEIGYASGTNEPSIDTELCKEGKADDDWIVEIKALAC
ncbi:unnamed protein product [Schistosoma turkestanicum]|nr:unnamed protein product [Schistosoma turkestanicum]